MERPVRDIEAVRSRICDVFLIVATIAAGPALAASLYRITTTGWLPIMAVQSGLFGALLLLVLFRKRLPYSLSAGFIVVALLVLGFGGMW